MDAGFACCGGGTHRILVGSDSWRGLLGLGLFQPAVEDGAIDELDIAACGEGGGVEAESAGCHDEAAGGAFGGDEAVELADDLDADCGGAPLLALDEEFLAALAQHEVEAAVRAVAAGFADLVAALAEGLADELFELAPAHGVQGLGGVLLGGCLSGQGLAFVAADG